MKYTHDNSTGSTVRILAVDLDDTLLKEDLTISLRNREALLRAEQAGVTVLLASGRVPESMSPYAAELRMMEREGYMIAGNGTILMRTDTGEYLIRRTLPVEEAVEACLMVTAEGLPVSVYHEGTVRASREDPWIDEDCRLAQLKKIIVDDFPSFIREVHPLKLLIPGDPEKIARLEPLMKERFGETFHIITSKPFFLELLPKGADKGTALRFLAEHLGVPRSGVMAIGDAMNDLHMIQYAGIGVAVGNALPALKEAASIVLEKTHEEDAVADAVERFILSDLPVTA